MTMETRGRRALWGSAALAAAWLLTAAWCYRGLFMDDAYIGFHYVANLLAGRGFVFNPPARVEGVTNTGWLLLLAPLAAPFGPPVAAKALNLLLLAATLALTARLAPTPRIAALCVLTTACHAELLGFSLLGMETALLATLLAALGALAKCGRWGWIPAAGTFAFLVHPEAGLVAPLGLLLAARSGALPSRQAARGLVACGLGLALATAGRWLYFGALLPNTFAAKPAVASVIRQNLFDQLLGSSVNVGVPFAGLFALPLAWLGWRGLRRSSPQVASFAAASALTGFAFALYARPDWTGLARYFAPYAPGAYLLLWTGCLEAETRLAAGERRAWTFTAGLAALGIAGGLTAFLLLDRASLGEDLPALAWIGLVVLGTAWAALKPRLGAVTTFLALAVAALGAGRALFWTSETSRLANPGYVVTSQTLVGPSLWMRDHLPPGTTIATRRIGAVSYFSGHPIFDYAFGLTEPEVAKLIHRRGEMFTSPGEAGLASVWRERSPDYLLEDQDVLEDILRKTEGTPESFRLHGLTYSVVHRFPIGHDAFWVLAGRR